MSGRRTQQEEPAPYDGVPTVDVKIDAEPEPLVGAVDVELPVVDVPVIEDGHVDDDPQLNDEE